MPTITENKRNKNGKIQEKVAMHHTGHVPGGSFSRQALQTFLLVINLL